MRNEIRFTGSIMAVRAVEDCIRASKKYTKGAFLRTPLYPMQGEDFPSKVLTEYYEVYPDMELNWNMLATDAWAWVWGETPKVDVLFKYNYKRDWGAVIVRSGNGAVRELGEGIPGFTEALTKTARNFEGTHTHPDRTPKTKILTDETH